MKYFRLLLAFYLTIIVSHLIAQDKAFSREDSLQGNSTEIRTCYKLNYYHLDVKFDIEKKAVSGSNLFRFTAVNDIRTLQFDLFENLKIEKVIYKNAIIPFKREFNAVYLQFPEVIEKGTINEFTVFYSGFPKQSKSPPWEAGIVYSSDSLKKPWVATVCEGTGASIWWPNKDQLADEVDSMMISVTVPNGLMDVSNGRLRKITDLKNGFSKFDWFVANPINNYDVAVNIGVFGHTTDVYPAEKGDLSIDYYYLPYNKLKATLHFGQNVKPMLKAYEYWFGPYPFYEDGYKLIEAPFEAMEHQSAIAYGNQYKAGRLGMDVSNTGWGISWDNCIIHESAHEWFGNSITAKDYADLWIHEAFACYAESLFIESKNGKLAGKQYLLGLRRLIKNDLPSVGYYNVNNMGSDDMYAKGAALLNTVRTIINNDEKWRGILRGLNAEYYHKTVTYDNIVSFINKKSGLDFSLIFDQYLRYKDIPELEILVKDGKHYGRFSNCLKGFKMSVRVRADDGEFRFVDVGSSFSALNTSEGKEKNIEVDTLDYLLKIRQ